MELTVYAPPLNCDGFNLSPFCEKLFTYLRLAKVPYRMGRIRMHQNPKGKFPYVRIDGQFLGDTERIIQKVNTVFRVDLFAGLTEEQHTLGRLLTRSLEEASYWTMVSLRYGNDESFRHYRAYFLKFLPKWGARMFMWKVRRKMLAAATAQGVHRHSRPEVVDIIRRDFAMYANILKRHPFAVGDKVSGYDAVLFGFLVNAAEVPWESEEKTIARSHPEIMAYLQRMRVLLH